MATIYQVARAQRREAVARNDAVLGDLIQAYKPIYQRIQAQIDTLNSKIIEARAAGAAVGPSWLYQEQRLALLEHQVEQQVAAYAGLTGTKVIQHEKAMAILGAEHFQKQIQPAIASPKKGVTVAYTGVSESAILAQVGFLADGSPLRDLLDELGPEAAKAVSAELVTAVGLGQGGRDTASRIRNAMGMSLTRALTIARTEGLRSYREAGRMAADRNADIMQGWTWNSALDMTTCVACFPGETLVSAPRPTKSFTRYYTGDVIVIETASGKHLTATPNHPILTPDGWVAAECLAEGGYVLSRSSFQRTPDGIDVHDNDVPTPIKQVAESLSVISREVKATAPDFHGDGRGSDVYVVRSLSLLTDDGDTARLQKIAQRDFSSRSMRQSPLCRDLLITLRCQAALGPASGIGTGMIFPHWRAWLEGDAHCPQDVGIRFASPWTSLELQRSCDCGTTDPEGCCQSVFGLPSEIAPCNLSIIEPRLSVAGSTILSPGDAIALRTGTQQPPLFEHRRQPLSADAKTGRDLLGSLPGDVCQDRVLKVFRRSFRGHVYNLQTDPGWYEASGIIVHNCIAMHGSFHQPDEEMDSHPGCRCSMTWITKTWDQLGFTGIPETSVRAIETGAEWLERQDEATQKAILGPTLYEVYAAGIHSLDEFVGVHRNDTWGNSVYTRSVTAITGSPQAAALYRDRARQRASIPPPPPVPTTMSPLPHDPALDARFTVPGEMRNVVNNWAGSSILLSNAAWKIMEDPASYDPTNNLAAAAQAVMQRIDSGPRFPTLTRGFRIDDSAADHLIHDIWAKGNIVHSGPQSWSKEDSVASNFAGTGTSGNVRVIWHGKDQKGFDISRLSRYTTEKEVISGGHLLVTDIKVTDFVPMAGSPSSQRYHQIDVWFETPPPPAPPLRRTRPKRKRP